MITVDLSLTNLRRRLDLGQVAALPGEGVPYAAVAISLRYLSADERHPEVLLIKRTVNPDDPWSGHMAFPGGRHERGDEGLLGTAIRETCEEVGIDLAREAVLIGRLDDLQAIGGGRPLPLTIAPFLFVVTGEVELTPQRDEVDLALWTSLDTFARGEVDCTIPYSFRGQLLNLPGYRVGEHIVWGLTYRMLQALFEIASVEAPG